MHHTLTQILILLLIASLVGMGARKLRLPYTLALVITGIVLSFIHLEELEGLHLTPELLLTLLLPPLLFEAAFHMDFKDFRRDLGPIVLLATLGVVLAALLTSGLVHLAISSTGLMAGFDWGQALLFGTVMAATDPISVVALFRELGINKRLNLLVEGESLLNDGVVVVIFMVIASILGLGGDGPGLQAGGWELASYSLRTLLWMAMGGALVGALVGTAISALTRQIDDHLIEITLTTVVAYGSYLLGETLHASGVLSTVAAGLVMGSFGSVYGMSANTRMAVINFWGYAAFLANTIIFLLIGIELDMPALLANASPVLLAFVAVLGSRALVVYSLTPFSPRLGSAPISTTWKHVMVWGGLRGSLSMVLVIGLPSDFAGRDTLILLVFGVVSLSLLLQGLSMSSFLGAVGLMPNLSEARAYDLARGRVVASRAVLSELERLRSHGLVDASVFRAIKNRYRLALEAAMKEEHHHHESHEELILERHLQTALNMAAVEKDALKHAAAAGVLGNRELRLLAAEMDQWVSDLERASREGPGALAQTLEKGPQRQK